MELSLEKSELNLITANDSNSVTIRKQRYSEPILLAADKIITSYPGINFEKPNIEIVATIANLKPEVVIIGSGSNHKLLPKELQAAFAEVGIAPECMSTSAACRTYNVLLNESRAVVISIQF